MEGDVGSIPTNKVKVFIYEGYPLKGRMVVRFPPE